MKVTQTPPTKRKFLLISVMLYITFMLADQVMMYRTTQVGPFFLTVGVFIMPLYYFMGDLIAEVYGYTTSRPVIWSMVLCTILFACIVTVLNILPEAPGYHSSNAYDDVLGRLLRSTIGGAAIAVVSGSYFNAYVISKLKIILKGRFFLARSVGSSAIGEAIQMVLGCLLLFVGVMPLHQVLQLMVELYIWQIGIGLLVSTLGSVIVRYLKKIDGDYSEQEVNFSPFKG